MFRTLCVAVLLTLTGAAPIAIQRQGVLYTGGQVSGDGVSGQMHVFYQIPTRTGVRRYPIVFVHGSRLTGAAFLGTPDGRQGWATWFVSRGWPVYVVDQPGKGRSGYFPRAYGAQERDPSRKQVIERFTASETIYPTPWPTAHLHSQWPGSGQAGDPVFEQFFASEVANMPDVELQYALTVRAVSDLLRRIGPAILLTHSQAGPLGWLIAQANPGLIKAIVAVEPTGNASRGGKAAAMQCGITSVCLHFAPALAGPAALDLVATPIAEAQDVPCWLQRRARYHLPWLASTPILIATGEASYHAGQDYCTSAFLTQAGVRNDYVYLPRVGIAGNGHMQMLENNNLVIAAFYERWLLARVR